VYLLAQWISQNTDVKVVFSGEGSDEAWQGYIYFHLQPHAFDGDRESRRLVEDLQYFDVLRADR
jgi:asparagine synthase (glutamine-hydrolysing)